MASTSASASFYAAFQDLKAGITTALETGSSTEASSRLADLRVQLAAALPSLPPYDQRSYDLQVKDLEAKLRAIRTSEKPKSKFAFTKRAGPSAGSARATPVPTGSTSTPSSTSSSTPSTPRTTSTPTPALTSTTPALPATTYTLSNHEDTYLTPAEYSPAPGDNYTLTLSDLTNVVVDLRPPEGDSAVLMSLHARKLSGCVVVAPILAGSVMLADVSGSILLLGAQQFRLHSSEETDVFLQVASLPIIEHCKSVRFGAYPNSLSVSDKQTGDGVAQVQRAKSHHENVQDFDWVRPGHSPNWSLITPQDAAFAELKVLDGVKTNTPAKSIIQSVHSA